MRHAYLKAGGTAWKQIHSPRTSKTRASAASSGHVPYATPGQGGVGLRPLPPQPEREATLRRISAATRPLQLNVGGVQVRVTAISGTASPRTATSDPLTLTQSLTAGTPVSVWDPPVPGL
ncbi:hypothetical protein GCM10023322_63150 [Rugosimonospora acidiphila]|uniref:Uncharacterized protein n=1 Tax=Rugosimonospora acidiphila TaxID=556531 RepID=A0ABP9SG60_9ACTN